MMMRHLASMGETYAHGSTEDASWNVWSTPSSSGPTMPMTLINRRSTGLRFRNPQPLSMADTSSEMLAMASRVREVLPHIPDELIIQVRLLTRKFSFHRLNPSFFSFSFPHHSRISMY